MRKCRSPHDSEWSTRLRRWHHSFRLMTQIAPMRGAVRGWPQLSQLFASALLMP